MNGAANTGDAGWAERATAKPCKSFVLLAMLVWLGTWGEEAFALPCVSAGTGIWSVAATWSGCGVGGVPGNANTATILNTHTVTLSADGRADALTINAGGTLVVSTFQIRVDTTTSVAGTITFNNAAGSTRFDGLVTVTATGNWNNTANAPVNFRGGLTVNTGATFTAGTGTYTFDTNNQAIGGASAITFGGVVAVANGVTVTNNNTNVVTIAGNLTAGNATSTWVNGANSTLNYSGAAAPMGTRVFTASAVGNTVNYTGAAQTVKLPSALTYYHLTLSGSGVKTIPAGTITIAGNFTLGAGVTYNGTTNSPAVNLAGNFSNSGTFNSGTGQFTFNGTSVVTPQMLTGATTFTNMTVNNTGIGLQLANDITVTTAAAGTLILTNGNIDTQTFTLIITRDCNAAGLVQRLVGTSGWIAGNLRKRIPVSGVAISCTFEIGDATTYRPINTTFASATVAGNVTGWSSQSAGDHPDTTNLASGIDPTLSVNRYWTLTNSGVVFTTCNATFNYVAGDLDGSAVAASFVAAKGSTCSGSGALRTCATWGQLTPSGVPTNTQITVNGLTSFAGDDFAIGQAKSSDFAREPQFIYTRERY